eukprot:GHVS01065959.1.p1 GENE.GHVS01065959.1~~GHVS01065959.1.p1  ORF type:complete len:179 (-),score=14.38 GHVS01065959.1:272-808(-)
MIVVVFGAGGGALRLLTVAVLAAALLMPCPLLCHALSTHRSEDRPSTVTSLGLIGDQVNQLGSASSPHLRNLIPGFTRLDIVFTLGGIVSLIMAIVSFSFLIYKSQVNTLDDSMPPYAISDSILSLSSIPPDTVSGPGLGVWRLLCFISTLVAIVCFAVVTAHEPLKESTGDEQSPPT